MEKVDENTEEKVGEENTAEKAGEENTVERVAGENIEERADGEDIGVTTEETVNVAVEVGDVAGVITEGPLEKERLRVVLLPPLRPRLRLPLSLQQLHKCVPRTPGMTMNVPLDAKMGITRY